MAALFGLGPTGPVSVQIGAGLRLNINTLEATGGAAVRPSLSLYAIGNTTVSTTSGVAGAGSLSISGAGGASIGISGSTIVVSAAGAASATSLGQTALGNTTGSTSSQTRAITAESISFAGIVSGGFSGGTLVISAAATAASGTALSRFAIGNTAGSTSSDVATLTQWTISAAGGLSAGMSGGSLILSAATTAAQSVQTLGLFAVGNTTTSVSSMTADARSLSFDGAGIVSIGMSGGSIVISASSATIAASGTVQNRFAAGNTTAATSSFANTLSIMSVSGAGGVSAGFDTNGVLVISGDTGGAASATSMGMTAVGNTAGSTSSQTKVLTAETLVGSGAVRVGFSNGSVVISGDTGTALGVFTMTYFEPRPMNATGTANGSTNGVFTLQPLQLPAALSINQVAIAANRGNTVGSIAVATSAAASGTASASGAYVLPFTMVLYTGGPGATSWGSLASTAMSNGISWSWNVSRTGASITMSETVSYFWGNGSAMSTSSMSTTASSAANATFNQAPGSSSNFSGHQRVMFPWATTLAPGFYVLAYGMGLTSTSDTAREQTWITVNPGAWNVFPVTIQGAAQTFRSGPGAPANYPIPYGGGAFSTAGSVSTSTLGTGAVSTLNGAGYNMLWMEMGMLPP